MQTTEIQSGGCQCGKVRFSFQRPALHAVICHCRMCQKAFGSFAAPLLAVNLDGFRWTRGEPGFFRSSRIVARGFCQNCGTPLCMQEDGANIIELAIGALDNPQDIPAFSRQSGIESRLSWFSSLHLLPEEKTEDERTPSELQALRSLQHPDSDTP